MIFLDTIYMIFLHRIAHRLSVNSRKKQFVNPIKIEVPRSRLPICCWKYLHFSTFFNLENWLSDENQLFPCMPADWAHTQERRDCREKRETSLGRCWTCGVLRCDVQPFSANIATNIASHLQQNTGPKTSHSGHQLHTATSTPTDYNTVTV